MYYLKKSAGGKALAATQFQDCEIWHQQLGHPSLGSLSHLSTNFGFQLNKDLDGCCDVCHRAKQTRNSFALSDSHALRPFSLVHCDLADLEISPISYFW